MTSTILDWHQGVSYAVVISRLERGRIHLQAPAVPQNHWNEGCSASLAVDWRPPSVPSTRSSQHLPQRSTQEQERIPAGQKSVLYNLIAEGTFHPFRHIRLVRSESFGAVHSQGESTEWGSQEVVVPGRQVWSCLLQEAESEKERGRADTGETVMKQRDKTSACYCQMQQKCHQVKSIPWIMQIAISLWLNKRK